MLVSEAAAIVNGEQSKFMLILKTSFPTTTNVNYDIQKDLTDERLHTRRKEGKKYNKITIALDITEPFQMICRERL